MNLDFTHDTYKNQKCLDQETLNGVLNVDNLLVELRRLVRGDRGSDNGSGDTASSTKSGLGADENVGNVLVLTEQRQVKNNLDGGSISSHDNELRNTTVQGLSGLVSTLLKLAQVGGLLNNVENLLGKISISERESTGVRSRHIKW